MSWQEEILYTALYFPHTKVRSQNLVRTALLTWDKLEWIAPHQRYKADYDDNQMDEAIELIGKKRVATKHEKDRIHDAVKDLLDQEIPETFRYSPRSGADAYQIWPHKLAPETWELLKEAGPTDGKLDTRTTQPRKLPV